MSGAAMTRSIAALLSLLSTAAAANITLFPDGAPGEVAGWPGAEVTLVGDDGVARVYNVSAPALEPFPLAGAGGPAPAVVIAPGGGYALLAYDKEGTDVARRFNALGFAAFVLKYRVPARPDDPAKPKWWAPLQDAQRAVSVVRARAAAWNVNGSAVGVVGFSAGGHLGAHASTAFDERAYDPVDADDDASCRPDFAVLVYPWSVADANDARATTLAPEINVTATTPRACLVHAADDGTAPFHNSVLYFEALDAAGVRGSRLEIDPKGGHGFGLCQNLERDEEVCAWPDAAAAWALDVLGAGASR